jgi:hypothetical protein
MATPLLDALKKALGLDKKPVPPTPAPQPKPGVVDYVKAWSIFKNIPFEKLGSAAALTALTVFLAISGLLAWVALALRFMLSLIR